MSIEKALRASLPFGVGKRNDLNLVSICTSKFMMLLGKILLQVTISTSRQSGFNLLMEFGIASSAKRKLKRGCICEESAGNDHGREEAKYTDEQEMCKVCYVQLVIGTRASKEICCRRLTN
ncbi:hypothetical protein MKW98_012311 [Papaver atlanticum]|uniref:Uncharacterized protein n=1 Tax=Papaver atlanticum TaxID=357466 RepID=A0AAD4T1R0_9MAGN|nr:hypothetical protein MKW98_012311 [Papaver atlanticum]